KKFSQAQCVTCHVFQLIGEDVTQPDIAGSPYDYTEAIEERKAEQGHPRNPCQRGSHGSESWNEFRYDQRFRAVAAVRIFRAPATGIRLKGPLENPAQNRSASEPSKVVPESVADERGENGDEDRDSEIEPSRACKGPRREHHGKRGNWDAKLF